MSARGPLQLFPMTPDLGQAGCSAQEDAVILGRHIGETVIRDGRLVPKEAATVIERSREQVKRQVLHMGQTDWGSSSSSSPK
ncbi:unnamed protein product [Ilex paraguariensis]|uniref:Uncharacterized protein n=1 Tax=Ilex paraguariensis TaxID=185542 RepID=A0ABC8RI07_9AQUA